MKTVNNRPSNTEQTRKLQAVLITLSAFFLMLGATIPTFFINVTVGAFFLVCCSMLLLFTAYALLYN